LAPRLVENPTVSSFRWPASGCVAPPPAVFFAGPSLHDAGMADAALDLARSGTPDPLRVQRLQELVARLSRWWLRRAAAEALLRCGLTLAVPALALALLVPAASAWILGTAAGLAVLGTASATWLAHRRGPPVGMVPEDMRQAVAGRDWSLAADELATWLECQHRPVAPAWLAWLERSLDQRLPRLDPQQLQQARPRPLGRLRWLLWPAILLALAWLWLQFFAPTWPGMLGGAEPTEPPPPPPPPPAEARKAAGRDEGQEPGAAAAPAAASPQPEPAGTPPAAPQAPEPDQSPPPPEPPLPPAPLLDLPGTQHFVVPDHIAEGPTTRQRMHAAEAPTPAAAPPEGVASPAPTPPPPPLLALREEFDRAAEAAQQARHVPAAERPLVQRYFRLLREAAR